MSEPSTLKVAVGDNVRIHYHLPRLRQSFAEGVVSPVEVTTLRGRGFLIDTMREVILGREQAVKPGHQNYALYEHPDEFPGRIELLPQPSSPSRPRLKRNSRLNQSPLHRRTCLKGEPFGGARTGPGEASDLARAGQHDLRCVRAANLTGCDLLIPPHRVRTSLAKRGRA